MKKEKEIEWMRKFNWSDYGFFETIYFIVFTPIIIIVCGIILVIIKILDFIRNKKLRKFIRFYAYLIFNNLFNPRKFNLLRKVRPYTMVEYEQLSSIYDLAREIEGSYYLKNKYIKGAFVECGVWKGGCAGIMAYVANQFSGRQTWLFDSFEGLPEATDKDGIRASYYTGRCKADYQDVLTLLFDVLHLPKDYNKITPKNVNIKIGLFQDTLPKAKKEIGDIAILRLDGDWYESTKCCLENLYDNVVEGGYVVLDDYNHWQGAKTALDEFLAERNLTPKLIKVDSAGIYFKK